MEKLDLRKVYKSLYFPSAKKVEVVNVPPFKFAMIDGAINTGEEPGTSPAFQEALQALYGISYTLKFISKLRKENPIDYTVMALEGLWWVEEGEFDIRRPEGWHWTAMIMQPEHISESIFQDGLEQLRKKKNSLAVENLRLEMFEEGLCVQMMHIGPYSDEPNSLAKMTDFVKQNNYNFCGKHHEIYLGDPRRTDPTKLKTVLRHPVELISKAE